MGREEAIAYLGESWKQLQTTISETLSSDIVLLNNVNGEILAHSGKMMRPMVSLLIAGACCDGHIGEDAVKSAAACELLHNATLLHDDVADKSDTRRGFPTLRKKIGASSAVLVGDYWLARTVGMVINSPNRDKLALLVAKTMSDLAEGEMIQLERADMATTTLEDYFRIIYCKTASLFETACKAGAISENAPQEYVQAAGEYGKALGVAFQIKDDILDYVGDGSLGKPIGIDLREKKITLPLLLAMADSGMEDDVRKLLRDIDNHPENEFCIRHFVEVKEGVNKAEARLDAYVKKAEKALEPLPDGKYKEFLVQIARYNSIRNN